MKYDKTRAERVAEEQAAEMLRKLEFSTPAKLGYRGLTPEELVAAEYQGWLFEEREIERKRPGLYGVPPASKLEKEVRRVTRAFIDDKLEAGWLPEKTIRRASKMAADLTAVFTSYGF